MLARESTESYRMADLLRVMEYLRDPASGCPWDLQQTFASIVPHTLEECYELADSIERNDMAALGDELGDVLFQVVFYARLGEEAGLFDFDAIVDGVVRKLLRRHPHVFPDGRLDRVGSGRADTADPDIDSVHRRWEVIKAQERQARDQPGTMDDVPLNLPALSRAAKLQKRAARVGFDWSELEPVRAKVTEELAELEVARDAGDKALVVEEVGDLLFACVNLARHLDVDPETALRGAGRKFEKRFRYIEAGLRAQGLTPQQADLDGMDALWNAAKRAGL